MLMGMRLLAALAGVGVVLSGVPARADVIVMKTGAQLRCVILEETETGYRAQVRLGKTTVSKARVERIERQTAEENEALLTRWKGGAASSRGSTATPAAPKPRVARQRRVSARTFSNTVLKADGPVLVNFYADWCGHSKRQTPILDQMAREYGGKVTVVKVDVDKNPSLLARFKVSDRQTPTLLFFRNGAVVKRLPPATVYQPAFLRSEFNRAGK